MGNIYAGGTVSLIILSESKYDTGQPPNIRIAVHGVHKQIKTPPPFVLA